jgi:beta-galactosidase
MIRAGKILPFPATGSTGFGVPIYSIPATYSLLPGFPHTGTNKSSSCSARIQSYGYLSQNFEIPQAWQGKDIIHSLDGIKGASYFLPQRRVSGNEQGQQAARSLQYSIKPKQQKRTCHTTHRWSDASYLECQEFWRMSGIERDVYVNPGPQIHIADYSVLQHSTRLTPSVNFHFKSNLKIQKTEIKKLRAYSLIDNMGKIISSESKPFRWR